MSCQTQNYKEQLLKWKKKWTARWISHSKSNCTMCNCEFELQWAVNLRKFVSFGKMLLFCIFTVEPFWVLFNISFFLPSIAVHHFYYRKANQSTQKIDIIITTLSNQEFIGKALLLKNTLIQGRLYHIIYHKQYLKHLLHFFSSSFNKTNTKPTKVSIK